MSETGTLPVRISSTNHNIKGTKDHITEAQNRFDGWKKTHEWSGEQWRRL